MKKFLGSFLVLATVLVGCGGGGSDTVVQAGSLRFIAASANAPDLDVYVNGVKTATALSYPGFSYYLSENAGSNHVQFRPANTGTNVVDFNVPLADGESKTVIAYNDFAHIKASVLTDDRSTPAPGVMRVRIFDLSPSAGNVDVYFNPPSTNIANVAPTNPNVSFEENLGYVTIPAGAYRIFITKAGTKNVIMDSGVQQFTSQEVRTIILLDKKGGGTPLLALINYDLN